MTESKKIVTIILEDELIDSLMDYVEEMEKTNKSHISITIKERNSDPIEKKRALKRWKKTFGYYSYNPNRFEFSLKDL
ncbi:MAG: hypothetical protein ACFFKA_09960 [Candidatus Thorarchaeota archaeon]